MKRCSNCDKTHDDDALRFCTECGTPLSEVPTISDPKQGTVKMGDELATKPMVVPVPQLEVIVQLEAGERETKKQDEWAGTMGFHRALEGFSVRIVPPIRGLSLRYMGHFQDIGDTEFVSEGEFLWAPGLNAKRLEGFAIELTGPEAPKFEITYWAHIQAWQDTRECTRIIRLETQAY
jgi:hypothetical protein